MCGRDKRSLQKQLLGEKVSKLGFCESRIRGTGSDEMNFWELRLGTGLLLEKSQFETA
jgi:hypothetical protein